MCINAAFGRRARAAEDVRRVLLVPRSDVEHQGAYAFPVARIGHYDPLTQRRIGRERDKRNGTLDDITASRSMTVQTFPRCFDRVRHIHQNPPRRKRQRNTRRSRFKLTASKNRNSPPKVHRAKIGSERPYMVSFEV